MRLLDRQQRDPQLVGTTAGSFTSSDSRNVAPAVTCAFTLMLIGTWMLMHRYAGLYGDAKLYAIQALARLQPTLAGDLYLQNASQDHFTVFSPFYAAVINLVGLPTAAMTLTVLFTTVFLAAAWSITCTLVNRDVAWLSVATLIVTNGTYGAYEVFNFSENFLTARSCAEALVALSLAYVFSGRILLGWLFAIGALFVHPLMALPGLLLLGLVALPLRITMSVILAGIGGVFLASILAVTSPWAHFITVIDGTWLQVVQERSQFLFVQQWKPEDWEHNAGPFISLAITVSAFKGQLVGRLAVGACIVGIAGLAIASISSFIGPVALFLQGQGWRWLWITAFIGALLLAPTACRIWRDESCGYLCALLLVAGWTFSEVNRTLLLGLALLIWLSRSRVSSVVAMYLRWAAAGLGVLIAVWAVASAWTVVSSHFNTGREPLLLQWIRSIAGLQVTMAFLFIGCWYWLVHAKSAFYPFLLCACLLACFTVLIPSSFRQIGAPDTSEEKRQFRDWRRIIPPESTVYVANGKDSASLAWFTLGRPSFLSLDQSAGVVFSRATALEVVRRSQTLLPLMSPDWKLQSLIRRYDATKDKTKVETIRNLTKASLTTMCNDPSLGFLIALEDVGIESDRRTRAGPLKGWHLYDCRQVRATAWSG